MQTILGSGGEIGVALAKSLTKYTDHVRLVSRRPEKVNENNELFAGDLTDEAFVQKAIHGSEVVYLTVGFEYKYKVWKEKWPRVMRNVIEGCKKHHARLVFFDNVYMYDKDHLSDMTEKTPVKPVSKKGRVRAQIADELMEEVKKGTLTALIARSADFLSSKNSVLVEFGIKNLLKGKRAMWLGDINKVHSFTYTPDAARATALLGNTPDAFNQVWHLPTDHTPLSSKQWMTLAAAELGVPLRVQVLSPATVTVLSLFVPILREFKEMMYQYDRDYFFDSSKFEQRFGYQPTPPEKAIAQIIKSLK